MNRRAAVTLPGLFALTLFAPSCTRARAPRTPQDIHDAIEPSIVVVRRVWNLRFRLPIIRVNNAKLEAAVEDRIATREVRQPDAPKPEESERRRLRAQIFEDNPEEYLTPTDDLREYRLEARSLGIGVFTSADGQILAPGSALKLSNEEEASALAYSVMDSTLGDIGRVQGFKLSVARAAKALISIFLGQLVSTAPDQTPGKIECIWGSTSEGSRDAPYLKPCELAAAADPGPSSVVRLKIQDETDVPFVRFASGNGRGPLIGSRVYAVNAGVFDPDSNTTVASQLRSSVSEVTIKAIRELQDGRQVAQLDGHFDEGPDAAAFDPQGRLAGFVAQNLPGSKDDSEGDAHFLIPVTFPMPSDADTRSANKNSFAVKYARALDLRTRNPRRAAEILSRLNQQHPNIEKIRALLREMNSGRQEPQRVEGNQSRASHEKGTAVGGWRDIVPIVLVGLLISVLLLVIIQSRR